MSDDGLSYRVMLKVCHDCGHLNEINLGKAEDFEVGEMVEADWKCTGCGALWTTTTRIAE